MNISDVIWNEIVRLRRLFGKDELAYLALTRKVEEPLRDRLAWGIHQKLRGKYFVARDYKHEGHGEEIDIGILKKTPAKPAVSLIQMGACSIITQVGRYPDKLIDDFHIMKNFSNTRPELYFIMIANLPLKSIPRKYDGYIRFSHAAKIRKCFQKYEVPNKMIEVAGGKWEEYLRKFKLQFRRVRIDAGKLYEIPVELVVWMVGPMRQNWKPDDRV